MNRPVESDYTSLTAYTRALAAYCDFLQPEQEPVLWMMPDGNTADKWALQFYGGQKGKPLYTTPPKREWVGLTDDEVSDLTMIYSGSPLYRAIEAKLKEKNT